MAEVTKERPDPRPEPEVKVKPKPESPRPDEPPGEPPSESKAEPPGPPDRAPSVEEPAPRPEVGPQELTAAQRKRLERADQAYRAGRGKEATTLLDGLQADAPRSAEVFALMANVQIDAGRTEEALSSARRAVELDPRLADAYLVLGVILQGQKDAAGAMGAYRKYLELAPKARYATTVRAQLRSLEREVASP